MSKELLKRIKRYNSDRDPNMVRLKYEALKESPFRFFRGTSHLFYEDIPRNSFILKSPKTWICGDLHLENFGTYKGNNRLAYFDMNDFDEGILAPCLIDVVRLCTSVFLAASLLKIEKSDCRKFVKLLLQSYAANLVDGRIKHIEQRTAKGFIKELLDHATQRTRLEMLQQRVKFSKTGIFIKNDELKAFAATKNTRTIVKHALGVWAKNYAKSPAFYKIIDVAERATGTGSIGIDRHLVLVMGKGKPDGYYLLDIKEAKLPTGLLFLKIRQPKWKNQAERLIEIQKRIQAVYPAYLNSIKIKNKWFVMKELQPLEDKLDFELIGRDLEKLSQLLCDMGAIVAWNNLRSGGRQGSAIADELIKYGKKMAKKEEEIVDYAQNYAEKTEKYWNEFRGKMK